MVREREKQSPLFADSWQRLSWVEHQIEQVRELTAPWRLLPRDAPLTIHLDEAVSGDGRIEFIAGVTETPPMPPEANFLIGNIVTDARSCLDMAVDAIWNEYGLSKKGVIVQFPLEDDFAAKRVSDARTRRFLEALDPRFAEVIERAQPDYVDGLLHIPANISALFISKLSNANKHRNITPVAMRTMLSSHGSNALGLRLHPLDSRARHGVPPLRFRLDYDPSIHADEDARRAVLDLAERRPTLLHLSVSQRVVVTGQEMVLRPLGFGEQGLPWLIELDTLLDKVPAFIRLTLRNLNRVHNVIQSDEDDPFYLLDRNGDL